MKGLLVIVSVLSSFLTSLEQKTLKADFVATVAETADAPMNYPGSITMKGKQFRLSMGSIEAAFDGQTMYMYSAETDELNLTSPTDRELIESNPFLFALEMAQQCEVTERASSDGKQTIITLVPREETLGINRFVLKVQNGTLLPLQVEVREGTKTSTLTLMGPSFITTEPKYVLEPEETTFVNDLRL